MKKTGFHLVILLAGLLLGLTGLSLPASKAPASEIGIRDRLGNHVSLGLSFKDEKGRNVRLGELFQAPVILAPVYFRCTDVCPMLLNGVVDVLNRLPGEPGRDYTVLAVSFDETDTPDSALVQKRKYLGLIQRPFPEGAWRFLTGDSASIRQLMDAVGFGYRRDRDGFLHPVALIVLSPGGKVSRYLYGSDFLPMDLQMALVEARYERAGPAISRALRFCFRYEPEGHRLVLNSMRMTGAATVAFALAVVLFLAFGKRKRPAKKES